MEERASSLESASSETLAPHDLVVLHTAEAEEWAKYLQSILRSSRKFQKRSILLYSVGLADQLHGYNFNCFQRSKCILLVLTGAFMEILCDPELQGALQKLLHPAHRVVALLCGVSEDDTLAGSFHDWTSWRKVYAEDDPSLYISTILNSIHNSEDKGHGKLVDGARESKPAVSKESLLDVPSLEPRKERKRDQVEPQADKHTISEKKENASEENSAREQTTSPEPPSLTCLAVQPSRVLCGRQETIFIIFKEKLDNQSAPQVEFSLTNAATAKVAGTLVNEYTISVAAPDMPAGTVSLALHTDQSPVVLRPVTYYTHLGEVSRHLQGAADPVDFLCQAFNLTSKTREALDSILTESLKSRTAAGRIHIFGIKQIEEDNMAAYQRDEELPTLLHFAAKYGLKKLTAALLQCPGALQAYSVMNKHGDYPNTLAEKSGFSDLRHFMDAFLETPDMFSSPMMDSIDEEACMDVYEPMTGSSQDTLPKYPGCTEDIYESMLELDPECAEDLYEVMATVDEDQNPQEFMLRKFFQGKPQSGSSKASEPHFPREEEAKTDSRNDSEGFAEEEEDPYNLCRDDIYDTLVSDSPQASGVCNRPPAPVPRSDIETPEPERMSTYISQERVSPSQSKAVLLGPPTAPPPYPVRPPFDPPPVPVHDPYAGMKTPGQRQLIALQERVKVGEISVEEAVQEFKAWQLDHERRASSVRYQQENLRSLRQSIYRRHRDSGRAEYEISAPLPQNSSLAITLECGVYEASPCLQAPPPPPPVARPIQRTSWKTGSTSSTSSTESNRLSTHSTMSYSSSNEPDFEDMSDTIIPPPRPLRPSEATPLILPPRLPPRIPERLPEKMLHERYISCPTRALPQRPTHRAGSPPPIPRRLR